jgi:predicted esterase
MRLLIVYLMSVTVVTAQNDFIFTKGLAAPDCHRYGREALVTDQLAYLLYQNQFKTPLENEKLFTNDQSKNIVWKKVEVDSTGRFRGESLTNGYIYLTYQSDQTRDALLNVTGNSMVFFNGEPHGGDIYNDGWMNIPVALKKGTNEILIRCSNFARWQGISARLSFPDKEIMLHTDDATLPHIIIGKSKDALLGAVVVINNTEKTLTKLLIVSNLNGKLSTSTVPNISPRAIRKVAFTFDPAAIGSKGDYSCALTLKQDGNQVDQKQITIAAVNPTDHHSYTFTSAIDGSVQYYSVAPPPTDLQQPALFLSVHGAGVQAIGQARAYDPKDWGVLVAPTNRRPRGFNWEDWGRIDALEVLELARKRFNPDPAKIYLTGHSMGGHGTWYLGATYPEKWAAIAPCAGYPTLTGYGSADGKIPDQARSEHEKILLRASNPSNVIDLATNYKDLGVYIHHGDDDRVVSVNYARQMRKILSEFHNDFSYYEYPGGSHWFGDESVDWPPLFDFFKWHKIEHDSTFDKIDFRTANPAISSKYKWASIVQQGSPLDYSEIHLTRDRKNLKFSGATKNVSLLRLSADFAKPGDMVSLLIDSVSLQAKVTDQKEIWLSGPEWKIAGQVGAKQKNTIRAGTFKEAFNNRMVFVYGTKGSQEERQWAYNKARFDAEVWYYRGNGAVDLIPDAEFDLMRFKDRGVILYGNAITNSAWNILLKDCPIKVMSGRITLGGQVLEGKDLGTYFTWPRADSDVASIGVVAGTGITGMRTLDPNQYFAAGSGFPDYIILSSEMLRRGASGIQAAGFFTNDWKLTK